MKRSLIVILLLGFLIVSAAVLVLAEPTSYSISRWTVDGGGGIASKDQYALNGTIGQADAHTASTGGNYTVRGGYWQAGLIEGIYDVYLPLVIK